MKKKSIPFLLAALLLAAPVFLSNCKKGDQGPPGTANVQYSKWIQSDSWVRSTTSAGSGKVTYYYDIDAPKVTQQVIDTGLVLVYAKFVTDPDGAGTVKLLPSDYYNLGSTSAVYRFQTALFPGKIRVICDITPTGYPSATNLFRYLIVPGGVPTGRLSAPPDYRSMTYEEVCRKYGFPE